MARKSFVLFAGAVGLAAAAVGAYAARKRRGSGTIASHSRPATSAMDNARRFASEWRADDALTDELASVVNEQTVAGR